MPRKILQKQKELSKTFGKLAGIYSACSIIVHEQPPLPFYHLLETKFLKHLLKQYVQIINETTEKDK